ncbi:FAM18-like protein (macronuclear) [Tetrahymena thermophila SB210]|uniref:Golgi apparatus membrane protein TVP23 homolog n=1 Tax=Tetrahymena thermophila (strain SB210) TaxID=312017 RepID=I7LX69_TETTS|nr:FAM18-like protein [Tetrahymena thermophila SB210]EAS03866.2 FAM18-like protein [Tetrahymena thermophila SB210]|eukprot:XP_001024111.2 FAM18-like protein [Tetrahymena thermophila SB210]
MQSKKQQKYKPPNLDEEQKKNKHHDEDDDDDDEEDEEEIQQKKKKKKSSKKKKEEKKDEEEEDEAIHEDDKYNIKNALHPTAVLFTIAFKAGAAFLYLFGGTLLQDQLIFISVVLLMSFDFWTVKNITGRLLVGLRWWSDYDEEGNEIWRFESPDLRKFKANLVDKSFFWTSQLAITIFWIFFLVKNIISFGFYWGVLDFIGFTLSSVNLYGFYKCSGEHQDKVKKMRNQFIAKGVAGMIS